MPVIGFEPEIESHYCNLPDARNYPIGTVWKCNDCPVQYRAQSVRDRGISSTEWVDYKGFVKLGDILKDNKKGETE